MPALFHERHRAAQTLEPTTHIAPAALSLSLLPAGATSIPMFLGFATKSLALCWVLQVVILVMVAYTMGACCSKTG